MTLEQHIEKARIKAAEAHQHRCTCDLSDGRQMSEHQRLMAIQHQAMEEAEEAARASYTTSINTRRKTKDTTNDRSIPPANQADIL